MSADNFNLSGWHWGCVSAIDSNGRPIWMQAHITATETDFVVRWDEMLTAFLELKVTSSAAARNC